MLREIFHVVQIFPTCKNISDSSGGKTASRYFPGSYEIIPAYFHSTKSRPLAGAFQQTDNNLISVIWCVSWQTTIPRRVEVSGKRGALLFSTITSREREVNVLSRRHRLVSRRGIGFERPALRRNPRGLVLHNAITRRRSEVMTVNHTHKHTFRLSTSRDATYRF